MAYLYRHIRLDKNKPFYIGIGSDKDYKRAYSEKNRNKYWHNISKYGYEVEILLDNLTWEEACQKEIEFIKLYGRKDLNEGTLVNMTNGGEGSFGLKMTDESKKKISENHADVSGSKNPMYGIKRNDCWSTGLTKETDERVKQISEKLKGVPKSKEHREKLSISKKGKPNFSIIGDLNPAKREDVKKKMSDSQKGNKYRLGCIHTEATKEKIRQKALEREHSLHTEKTKEKMRQSALKKIKIECEYCKKSYDPGNYKKSHGEKCKLRN